MTTAEQDFLTVITALEIPYAERWSENPIWRRMTMEKLVKRLMEDPALFPIIAPVFSGLTKDQPEFRRYFDRARDANNADPIRQW